VTGKLLQPLFGNIGFSVRKRKSNKKKIKHLRKKKKGTY